MSYANMLLALSGSIIYSQAIAKELGPEAAVLFGVLCRESERSRGEEFSITTDELMSETALRKYSVEAARTVLGSEGLISMCRKSCPSKYFYKVHLDAAVNLIKASFGGE